MMILTDDEILRLRDDANSAYMWHLSRPGIKEINPDDSDLWFARAIVTEIEKLGTQVEVNMQSGRKAIYKPCNIEPTFRVN